MIYFQLILLIEIISKVFILKEENGEIFEPFENLMIDVPTEFSGSCIERLAGRKAVMESMESNSTRVQLRFTIPARGLIGFMTDFMTSSHGYGIINHSFLEYRQKENFGFMGRMLGVLVSINEGQTTGYASAGIEDRGELLVEPGTKVYEGMIVGICNREEDLAVNITKEKQQTNQRSSTKDTTVVLKRPRVMNLENYLEFINDDELVEITPKSVRIRKRILNTNDRKRYDSYHTKK